MLPSSLSPVYTVQDPSQGTGLSTKKASPRASADTIKTNPHRHIHLSGDSRSGRVDPTLTIKAMEPVQGKR